MGALEEAVARGASVATRPLLIPERVSLSCGEPAIGALVDNLAALGLELRVSAPDAALILAVPDALARVPARDLACALSQGQHACRDVRAWLGVLVTLAGQTPVDDPSEAQVLLEALHTAGAPVPWVVLDASAVAKLSSTKR
jgi:hypothetical protein